MRILSRVALVTSVFAAGVMSIAPLASANHVQEVLGDKTDVSQMQFPGLAAGPGFIVPDSSFYPLDQLVQEIRLVLAFVPEQQAVVQKNILGERLAEARLEVSRGNLQATEVALSGAEKAARGLAKAVSDAAANGRGSAELARSLNQTLGEYRSVLDTAADQAPTSLSYRLNATSQVLLETKVRVEDELPGDELAQAIDDDLQYVVDREVLGIQTASDNLMKKVTTLDNRSSLSAEQKRKYEELMASKSAIKKDYQEQRKKLLEDYQAQKKQLQEERKKLYEQIKLLMKQLQENQKTMQQLERAAKNGGTLSKLSPTVSPSPTTPSN